MDQTAAAVNGLRADDEYSLCHIVVNMEIFSSPCATLNKSEFILLLLTLEVHRRKQRVGIGLFCKQSCNGKCCSWGLGFLSVLFSNERVGCFLC